MKKFEVKKKEIRRRRKLLEVKLDELSRKEAYLQGRREKLLAEEKEREERRSRINIFNEVGDETDFPVFFNDAFHRLVYNSNIKGGIHLIGLGKSLDWTYT